MIKGSSEINNGKNDSNDFSRIHDLENWSEKCCKIFHVSTKQQWINKLLYKHIFLSTTLYFNNSHFSTFRKQKPKYCTASFRTLWQQMRHWNHNWIDARFDGFMPGHFFDQTPCFTYIRLFYVSISTFIRNLIIMAFVYRITINPQNY